MNDNMPVRYDEIASDPNPKLAAEIYIRNTYGLKISHELPATTLLRHVANGSTERNFQLSMIVGFGFKPLGGYHESQ